MQSINLLLIFASCYLFSVVLSEPRKIYRNERISYQNRPNTYLNDRLVPRTFSWITKAVKSVFSWIAQQVETGDVTDDTANKIRLLIENFKNGQVTYRAILQKAPSVLRQSLKTVAPYISSILSHTSRLIQEAVKESESQEEYEDSGSQS